MNYYHMPEIWLLLAFHQLQKMWTDIQTHWIPLTATAVALSLFLFVYFKGKGKKSMSREQRKELVTNILRQTNGWKVRDAEVKSLLGDKIGDVLCDLWLENEITDEEYKKWVLRCAKQLGLLNMLPRHRMECEGRDEYIQIVKDEIKERLGNGVYKHKPKIPGDIITKEDKARTSRFARLISKAN